MLSLNVGVDHESAHVPHCVGYILVGRVATEVVARRAVYIVADQVADRVTERVPDRMRVRQWLTVWMSVWLKPISWLSA